MEILLHYKARILLSCDRRSPHELEKLVAAAQFHCVQRKWAILLLVGLDICRIEKAVQNKN